MSDAEAETAADEHDHDHDHDHDHEPTEAEIALARERIDRLSASLDAIPLDELDRYLSRAGLDIRKSIAARLSLRLDPRFLKGGMGRLVRARMRKLGPQGRVELAAELTAPVDAQTAEYLGDDYESPTDEQLDGLVDHLIGSYPASLVRTYLAVTAAAQAEVAPTLDRMLGDDTRLAAAGTE